MRNFKWIMKVAVLIFLFFIAENFLGILLSPTLSYSRVAFHELYNQDNNIDLAFLGASHTYRSFDPDIFDEKLGVNSFNLGTSSQDLIGTYYLLKETLRKNKIKQVVLETTYSSYNIYEGTTNPVVFFLVYDYMAASFNKADYFLHAAGSDIWTDALFWSYRYKHNFTQSFLSDSIREKVFQDGFRNYEYPVYAGIEEYRGKGFVYAFQGFEAGNAGLLKPYVWSEDNMYQEALVYLDKIITLCQQNNIEIILATAPIAIPSLINMQNYDDTHAFFDQLAKKYGLTYYDFNLVKPEVFARPDRYFYDDNHMNGQAATEFSNLFSDFLIDHDDGGIDMQDYFYGTFDALWADIDYVTAVGLRQEGNVVIAESLSGKNVAAEYEFLIKAENGEYRVVQEFQRNASIALPLHTNVPCIVRVNARASGSLEAHEAFWEMSVERVSG